MTNCLCDIYRMELVMMTHLTLYSILLFHKKLTRIVCQLMDFAAVKHENVSWHGFKINEPCPNNTFSSKMFDSSTLNLEG